MDELALTAGLIWLAVPVVQVALVRVRLSVALPVALIGMLTFLVAWCGSVVTAGVLSRAGVETSSLAWALVVSCSAGICEETARTLAFRTSYLRKRACWNTARMHTLGHAGSESVIEAFTDAATFALVLTAADLVPDTELARLTALTSRELVFVALLRVTLGPVIHGLFATFAAAAVSQGRPLL
jgi:uncharacterized membrane protein YhfC